MSDHNSSRTALITGGASGLGLALATRLASDGWSVALTDIDGSAAATQADRLSSTIKAQVTGYQLDVTDEASWISLRTQLQTSWQKLDLLVNNAGILATGAVDSLPAKKWNRVFDVNLNGCFLGCHTMIPWLKERGLKERGLKQNEKSHILNIASIMGFVSGPGNGAYNASKAAVISLSETLHAELRSFDVGVSVACPGFFATNLISSAHFSSDTERTYADEETRSSGLTADEVAEVLLAGVRKNKFYILTPFVASRGAWFLKRLAPRVFLRLVERIGRRRLKGIEAKLQSSKAAEGA